jgi:hypothetical protein
MPVNRTRVSEQELRLPTGVSRLTRLNRLRAPRQSPGRDARPAWFESYLRSHSFQRLSEARSGAQPSTVHEL